MAYSFNYPVVYTYGKPYHIASLETLRRRIKETWTQTNLIENVSPHTCRSASATKAFNMCLDIMDILRKATQSCFSQHIKNKLMLNLVDFSRSCLSHLYPRINKAKKKSNQVSYLASIHLMFPF